MCTREPYFKHLRRTCQRRRFRKLVLRARGARPVPDCRSCAQSVDFERRRAPRGAAPAGLVLLTSFERGSNLRGKIALPMRTQLEVFTTRRRKVLRAFVEPRLKRNTRAIPPGAGPP
ncbi:hypothetical protein MRX96_030974 [Rhipicephalus microplus]